jgi:hypothetical protein
MAGFWCPSFVKGVNVPGYHLHFLRADGKRGGHVLDFVVDNATLEIDDSREFSLILPMTPPSTKPTSNPTGPLSSRRWKSEKRNVSGLRFQVPGAKRPGPSF